MITIGSRIIEEIMKQGMLTLEEDGEDYTLTWAANAPEQLTALVVDVIAKEINNADTEG